MTDLRAHGRVLTAGVAAVIMAATFGLAGCASPSTAAPSAAKAPSASSTPSAAEDDADTDDDGADDAAAGNVTAAPASTFDTAQAVVSAFMKLGGVCANPVDSHLSLATSSIDCVGPAGHVQTIAVFASADEAKKWYRLQTVVKTDFPTSYLLGENWAMIAEATSMNIAQKLGVRDQTLVMN